MRKDKLRIGRFPILAAVFGLVLLLMMGILGEWGLLDLIESRKDMVRIQNANMQLDSENKTLARRIYRLKNDRQYIENIVRQELGVVGDKDLIIKLPRLYDQPTNK